MPGGFRLRSEEALRLYPDGEYAAYGLERNGDLFTPIDDDPRMVFSIAPSHVWAVTIAFAEPLQQDTAVQVFFAAKGEDFSEGNSVRSVARWNSTECTVILPDGQYAGIRLDIDGQAELQEVITNQSDAVRYAKWLCIALLAVLVVVAVVFLLSGWRAEWLYLVCALLLGLVYLTSLTPLSAPDEVHHYQSAYELSNVLLLRADKRELGDSADFDYTDFTGHQNTAAGYSRIASGADAPAEQGQEIAIPTPRERSYFPMYLPQAMGIALARVLDLNFIWTFWLGRLFNLLFYVLLTWWAIRTLPRFQTIFFLVALAPMSLQQAASFSYDAFVNALSLLLLALLLKAILEEGTVKKRTLVAALIVNILLSPAKIVYYPITALALLIPKSRFRNRKTRILFLFAFFLLPLLFMLLFRLQILTANVTAAERSVASWDGGYNYTLPFLLSHPARTAKLFVLTVLRGFAGWMADTVGCLLSGLSLPLPKWIPLMYLALLFFATIRKEQEAPCLRGRERLSFGAVSIIVGLLIMLSMCLGWTSDTSEVILGVQGRYFIPIMPLALLTLNGNTLILRKNYDRELMLIGSLLNAMALLKIVFFTLTN